MLRIITLVLVLMVALVGIAEAGQAHIMYNGYVVVEGVPVDSYIVLEEIPAGTFEIMPEYIIIGGQHCEVVTVHEMEGK